MGDPYCRLTFLSLSTIFVIFETYFSIPYTHEPHFSKLLINSTSECLISHRIICKSARFTHELLRTHRIKHLPVIQRQRMCLRTTNTDEINIGKTIVYKYLYLLEHTSTDQNNPSRKHVREIPHFYIIKLGFTEVYLVFLFVIQNVDCGYS